MLEISKTFTFSAAHQLTHLPEDHPCHRLHGHNYTVRLVLRVERLNEYGFVVDYRALDVVKTWIDEKLDHRNLNDVFSGSIWTTAENLARLIFERFKVEFDELYAVDVMETEKTCARYTLDQ